MEQMDYNFKLLFQTRSNFLNLLNGFSLEQINKVPDAFKNNLIWNFGHIICTQQILCYKLAGLSPNIEAELIDKYKKGSAPDGLASQQEFEFLKSLALSNIDKLESDYKEGKFSNYTPYETSYGIKLNSIEEAIAFNNVHEGLHFGYSMALRKHL